MTSDKVAKHIVASTCTLIALAIIEVATIGAVKVRIDNKKFDLDYSTTNTIDFELQDDGAYAEYLGKEYDEPAEEGYTYYRIYIPAQNNGTRELSKSDVYVSTISGDYSDTRFVYSNYDKYDFTSEDKVPSGREGYVSYIIQIKDEVEFIKIDCKNYSGNDTEAEYMIEVPKE